MSTKFRKGQQVICTHYKDKPTCIITDTLVDDDGYVNIWVREIPNKTGTTEWWGPANWFKAIPKKRKKVVRHSGFLCDDNIVGCTCNQSSFGG